MAAFSTARLWKTPVFLCCKISSMRNSTNSFQTQWESNLLRKPPQTLRPAATLCSFECITSIEYFCRLTVVNKHL